MRIGRTTYVYWWSNPKHRSGKKFSAKWRGDLGMGVFCSWLDIGPLEIRQVSKAAPSD